MPTQARDRLLKTAEELFYAEGIQAVGVERLLVVSGVGRASFYRHFAGKDALVAAVLKRRGQHWLAWLETAVEGHGGGPLAVFDALADSAQRGAFHGCAFINAMAETADTHSEVYQLARAHKRRIAGYVEGLIKAAGHPRPEALAAEFVLLMDGATVTAMHERTGAPALRARSIAERLLA
ncbi:TetR/AcrR family transcriptional regulator [Streptomyces zagrosensis]|uniref:AcrR family transcriptional regulator n=1 Tax=Streptomyces zagrosensis TaxID=1042984 RepID=A0A7W9Q4I6_9ACTN|nr:TetR/AcrR family transcriptional regulator [Streptomyces zagrosensis]MBB5933058.1 AcrR family transcriptional regulator [Streptomyces zagrosensis]